jgi:carbon-monoxide dehydrogenase large subunit
VHAVVVDVDVGLGRVRLEDYVVAHDCGVLVNPMLAEGQIVGGTVQGIGGGMLEELIYDSEGQLLAGSFLDYLLPSAADTPRIRVVHEQSASPSNPFGVKGLGEGGAIGPPVAIANAVCDALAAYGVEFNDTPITPERIFEAVRVRARAA